MRHFKLFVFLLILAVLLGSVGYIYFFCKLESVEVRGAQYYSADAVEELVVTSELDRFAPILYLKGKVKTVEAPFIEKIDIELTGKNSVRIDVYEKVITACVEKMGQFFYFDNDGTVVEVSQERNPRYPLVRGISFESTVLGEKLDTEQDSVFGTILELVMLCSKNELTVDEIVFSDSAEVTLKIGNKVVELGRQKTYDLHINNLPEILKAAGKKAYLIDLKKYSESNLNVIAKPME